jgi:hypothetical protein
MSAADCILSLSDEEREQVFLYILEHGNFDRVIELIGMNLDPKEIDKLIKDLQENYATIS